MKKFFIVLAIVATVALPASAAFSQQKEAPPTKAGQGMMEGMQGGGMMCPMMGMGGMGMRDTCIALPPPSFTMMLMAPNSADLSG